MAPASGSGGRAGRRPGRCRPPHSPGGRSGPAGARARSRSWGENSAALYRYGRRAELAMDRIAVAKATSEREGPGRTNLRYGYVPRPSV